MPASKALNAREQAFVDEYLQDLNATQAAIRAGYSQLTADAKAFRWVGKSRGDCPSNKRHVWDAVQEAIRARSERVQINSDYVLKRLAEIDQMDVLDILEDCGAVKPIKAWPKVWRTSISALDVSEIAAGQADAMIVLKKIKWPDKVKNLELIGRHVDVKAWEKEKEGPTDNIASTLAKLAAGLPG